MCQPDELLFRTDTQLTTEVSPAVTKEIMNSCSFDLGLAPHPCKHISTSEIGVRASGEETSKILLIHFHE